MDSSASINQSGALTNKISNEFRNHRTSTVSKKAFNAPSTAIFSNENSLSENSQNSNTIIQNQVSANFEDS